MVNFTNSITLDDKDYIWLVKYAEKRKIKVSDAVRELFKEMIEQKRGAMTKQTAQQEPTEMKPNA